MYGRCPRVKSGRGLSISGATTCAVAAAVARTQDDDGPDHIVLELRSQNLAP
jgi:hypothetical protein